MPKPVGMRSIRESSDDARSPIQTQPSSAKSKTDTAAFGGMMTRRSRKGVDGNDTHPGKLKELLKVNVVKRLLAVVLSVSFMIGIAIVLVLDEGAASVSWEWEAGTASVTRAPHARKDGEATGGAAAVPSMRPTAAHPSPPPVTSTAQATITTTTTTSTSTTSTLPPLPSITALSTATATSSTVVPFNTTTTPPSVMGSSTAAPSTATKPSQTASSRFLYGNMDETLFVLVQHADAVTRLAPTAKGDAPTSQLCSTGASSTCHTVLNASSPRARLSWDLLPSWTLQTVVPSCKDCADRYAYDLAVQDVELRGRRGVFALPRSPRGLLGPMVFAMSSVTNDINVQEELPKWVWMRHVYPDFPAATAAKDTPSQNSQHTPLIAVMGIPSTDHPARHSLRDAQRATWMSYQEVARTENNFEGALLPLFLFAAAEPFAPARKVGQPGLVAAAANCLLCNNLTALLPTEEEFLAASTALMAMEAGQHYGGPGLEERRVRLRTSWREESLTASPCEAVVAEQRPGDAASPAVSYLSAALSLPVMPAFVAPAQYICCASAALWKEALTHRNVVWIDMMTDRRPTTNKKLGDTTKWGLPVEVGMSQKLILWLSYAYHAFPNVPYIIKGDDDMYLKVPQFLSDARMLRRGRRNGRLPPPPLLSSAVAGGKAVNTYVDPDEPFPMDKTKCMYWGSTRRMRNFYFNAGMLFVLQRRLVQVVLERPQEGSGEKDLLELAARNYSKSLFRLYKSLSFDKEDVLIGATLHRRHARAKELCYKHQVWYGFEERVRFHDLRKGRAQPITVNTVVAHRCRPADLYFMQYFFQNELAFARADVAPGESREDLAREAAAAWVAETRKTLPDDVTNWNSLPEVVWYHNVHTGPSFWIAENDHVPVYNVSYTFWNSSQLTVEVGYKGRSHAMSKP
jgi:phosphoglycan beta-1,3-galactosyltransferase